MGLKWRARALMDEISGWNPPQWSPKKSYIARFTPEQEDLMNQVRAMSLEGSPLTASAREEALQTLQGKYLTPETNPYLKETYEMGARRLGEQFREQVAPELRRSAMGAGAYGGSRHGVMEGMAEKGLAQSLGDLATQLYGGAYEAERARQYGLMPQAESIAQSRMNELAQAMAVDEAKQQMRQALLDEAKARWMWNRMSPLMKYGLLGNVIGSFGGIYYH